MGFCAKVGGEDAVKPVLVVDCYVEGDGSEAFRRLLVGRPTTVWRALHEPRPPAVLPYAGILISGSSACVTAPEPWMDALTDLILDASVAGVPVLGICIGHQMIAHALFGQEAVRKSATPEIGWTDISVIKDDPLFAGLSDGFNTFNTFESHFDEVVACPGMTVFASSERCAVQAYRVEGKPIWGVQFHAEMTEEEAVALASRRITDRPDLGFDLESKLAEARDSTDLASRLVENFLGPA